MRLICWTETVANERGAHPFMPSFCLVSEIDSFSHLLIKEDIVTTHCTQDFGRKGEGAEIIRTMKRERWEDLKTRRGFLLSNSITAEICSLSMIFSQKYPRIGSKSEIGG